MKTTRLISTELWSNRRILLLSTLIAAPLGLFVGKAIYGLCVYSFSAPVF